MSNTPKLVNNFSFVFHAWWTKPMLVLRSFNFLFHRLFCKSAIRGMDIAVTYNCNMHCEHCNIASQVDKRRKEMDADDIIRTIRQLQKMGGFYVTFTGGEPLLELPKIEEVIAVIGKKSMLYQIQTNGLLLNDDLCRHLKSIGIDNVQVSFDDRHETQDWDALIDLKEKQLNMLRKWGFDVIFTWLASHQSLNTMQLDDIVRFSNSHKVKIGLNFAVAQGRWEKAVEHLLTPEDSAKLRSIARRNKYIYIDLQNNLFRYGCPAFSERLHINAYGDVQPCTFFQISFGNIKKEPLENIWMKGLKTEPFAGFPDHCPPAENRAYINRMLELSKQATLPVDHTTFFNKPGLVKTRLSLDSHAHTRNQNQRCVVCQGAVINPVLGEVAEVEYGIEWTGKACACERCGLVHQVPLPSKEEALSFYPENYIHYMPYITGLKGFLMKLYMRRTIRLLKQLNSKPGDRLLDIGCGAGEKLAIIRDTLKLQVIGVEPTPSAAEKASKMFGLEVVNDFFKCSQFQPESFDLIRINHVIEHVPDPVKMLDELFILLKPGGWLIGETENNSCLSFKIFGKYWALLHFPYHLLIFDKKTLTSAFQTSRFRDVAIQDLSDPSAWSLSLQNVIRKNQPFNKRKSNRMPGYTSLTVLCYPLAWFEKITSGAAVVEFKAQKPCI